MHPQQQRRRNRVTELFWSFVLIALPLTAALAVNEFMGWWEGVAAFLVVGAVLGLAAYSPERRVG
ncbi:hypothetical protein [Pseudonocardia humida]|uniref:Uncharacterized protein n=1 Tax=Pseudonocardia humida TaxID=2800819 RepID=A0ABT1A3V7_9PSEU|nr:hypothetical protein [Pseudonocardia humida]MCO1657687.1 hypothetical protein [Pseudonocardia humida]